jgi:hypothetical protein
MEIWLRVLANLNQMGESLQSISPLDEYVKSGQPVAAVSLHELPSGHSVQELLDDVNVPGYNLTCPYQFCLQMYPPLQVVHGVEVAEDTSVAK